MLLQDTKKCGKLITVKDGYIVCPVCRFKTSQQLRSDTEAVNLRVWCRKCKQVTVVNIAHGQCFLSQC